ncbi:MAG: hypothetical protein H6971_05550 [Gammaproteobacteria bacterium]|nr:hypothetical protein [Gammaproteobacteria bacterium]
MCSDAAARYPSVGDALIQRHQSSVARSAQHQGQAWLHLSVAPMQGRPTWRSDWLPGWSQAPSTATAGMFNSVAGFAHADLAVVDGRKLR